MIRYALRCENGHEFDGWFRSSDGFEDMRDTAQISCASCGSTKVDRALMAPALAEDRPLTSPRNTTEGALDKLRRQVEENSDYVGAEFVKEARAMHDGSSPTRAIHGEARLEEARALIEDGIPVTPLPFLLRRRAN